MAVGDGMGVGLGVAVGEGMGGGVGMRLGVAAGVGAAGGVGVGVGVSMGRGVAVGVSVGGGAGVAVAARVGEVAVGTPLLAQPTNTAAKRSEASMATAAALLSLCTKSSAFPRTPSNGAESLWAFVLAF